MIVLKWVLYSSLVFSWAVVLYFLCDRLRSWFNPPSGEVLPAAARMLPLLLTTAVMLSALFISPRSGYDNEHDLRMLGVNFFSDAHGLMHFKEISPLFTDWVSDAISGYSLNALLWKNRFLQGMSVFIFFLGLRRLGAGLTVALTAAAFFGLNFLTLLNASTFSSAPANMFIWQISLLALAEAFAARELGAGGLLWIMCSLVLVTCARYEFLPVNLLILLVLLMCKQRSGFPVWRPVNLVIFGFFTVMLTAWAFLLSKIGPSPVRQLGSISSPVKNFLIQLGERNFGAVSGHGELSAVLFVMACLVMAVAGRHVKGPGPRPQGKTAAAGAEKSGLAATLIALGILAVWMGYFSCIYKPMDEYPLHFMRHQFYYFVPFAYLFALGLSGLDDAWLTLRPNRRFFPVLCGFFGVVYGVLNLRAAVRLNPELRTNDREIAFLASAREFWPKDAELILYPSDDPMDSVLRKYFPVLDAAKMSDTNKFFVYKSARGQVFSLKKSAELRDEQHSSGVPDAGGLAPWRESSFAHRFYTVWSDVETREQRRVVIGFYPAGAAEMALVSNMKASRLLREGRPREARLLLEDALRKYQYCGLCSYNAAAALLLSGKEREARKELLTTVKFFPALADERYIKAFLLSCEGKDKEAGRELNAMFGGQIRREVFELTADLRFGLGAVGRGRKSGGGPR